MSLNSFSRAPNIGLLALFLAAIPLSAPALETAGALVAQAGNANDDWKRQAALEKLASLDEADEGLRKEAKSLAEFVRRWNEGGLKFYTQSVRGKPVRALGDYDFGVAQDSPLWPVAELYRGRMLAWMLIENSNVRTHPVDSRWFKDQAICSFRRVSEAFPENEIARMYLGQALPWGESPAPVAGAPICRAGSTLA